MEASIHNLHSNNEANGQTDSSGENQEENASTQPLPPVEPVADPWQTATQTEEPSPHTYQNPWKHRDNDHSGNGPTTNSRLYTESTTDEQEREREIRNPAELKRNASAAIAGLINPLCIVKGWQPLSEDEADELADAAVDTGIFPDWIWHPVLRLVGVSSKIVSRRVRRVHDVEDAA